MERPKKALMVGDCFTIGEVEVEIEHIRGNKKGDLVFDICIIGARFASRSKMMLILPKGVLTK